MKRTSVHLSATGAAVAALVVTAFLGTSTGGDVDVVSTGGFGANHSDWED